MDVGQLHNLIARWLRSVEGLSDDEFSEHTLEVSYSATGVPETMEYDLANGDDEEHSMRVTLTPLP